MNPSSSVSGLDCRTCGTTVDPAVHTHRCPECDGFLEIDIDLDEIDLSPDSLADRRFDGLGRYAELLPLDRGDLISIDEGTTPLIECPTLADELGVAEVYVKDEGRNPTGSVADRGLALAVSAARAHGASDVALPTTGIDGQAAAAYAARAGLDSHSFVPSRASHGTKAMINVHGGDMSVVGGRFDDARDAFDEAMTDEDWYSVAAFETPYRVAGQQTLAYEIAEQLDWTAPDAVVIPTGHGTELVGLQTGITDLAALGWIDDTPGLYAAQAEGCAPLVTAFETGQIHPVDVPDTICGHIEIPDPEGASVVLEAIRESDGGAVATPDSAILEHAVGVAQDEGIEMGASSGPAASGAAALADRGEFDSDDTVVLLNTVAADKEADILRSHLMGKGI